jgi:hypothetical protein
VKGFQEELRLTISVSTNIANCVRAMQLSHDYERCTFRPY